jgi:membrane protease YdiL (CAAX protease family)
MNTQSVEYKSKAFESRNLVIFALVILGMTGVAVGFVLSPGGMPTGIFGSILGVLFMLMPCITAFVLTAISEGKTGIKTLWRRFRNRNLSLKWLLVVLLTFPVFWLIVNLVYRTLDHQDYPVFDLPNPPWKLITMFITYFIYAMGEEFGWRGYVLPRLQARWSALTSSILVGLLWAGYHLGSYILTGSHAGLTFWEYAFRIILLSIMYTWIFNNTKGSVLAVVLFHAASNVHVFWTEFVLDNLLPYFGVLLAMAILIVAIFGPKNLVRQKAEKAVAQDKVRRLSVGLNERKIK